MDTRDFSRVPVDFQAVVKHRGGVFDGRVTDLSLHGMFLTADFKLPKGEEVNVSILVDVGPGAQWLTCLGKVVRVDKGGIGVEVHSMNKESFATLRHLLATRCEDPGKIDQELRMFIQRMNAAATA